MHDIVHGLSAVKAFTIKGILEVLALLRIVPEAHRLKTLKPNLILLAEASSSFVVSNQVNTLTLCI